MFNFFKNCNIAIMKEKGASKGEKYETLFFNGMR
jgi:hypothetical protein